MPAGSIADRNHIAMLEQTTDEYRLGTFLWYGSRISTPYFLTGLNIVEKMFRKGWKHSRKPKPALKVIFRVVSTEESLRPYRAYR